MRLAEDMQKDLRREELPKQVQGKLQCTKIGETGLEMTSWRWARRWGGVGAGVGSGVGAGEENFDGARVTNARVE